MVTAPTVLARTPFSLESCVALGFGPFHPIDKIWRSSTSTDSRTRAYASAARVNVNLETPEEQEVYTSHTHMLLFVQPDDESNLTYVVDVGFGGEVARPVPLLSGDESIVMGLGPAEENRLFKAPLPQSSLSTSAIFVPERPKSKG
jgi:hypothetical protein